MPHPLPPAPYWPLGLACPRHDTPPICTALTAPCSIGPSQDEIYGKHTTWARARQAHHATHSCQGPLNVGWQDEPLKSLMQSSKDQTTANRPASHSPRMAGWRIPQGIAFLGIHTAHSLAGTSWAAECHRLHTSQGVCRPANIHPSQPVQETYLSNDARSAAVAFGNVSHIAVHRQSDQQCTASASTHTDRSR